MATSFFIDVNKPFFEELLSQAKEYDDTLIKCHKKEDLTQKRKIYREKIETAQRIVYPSLHQKWIAEIREKHNIPVEKGFDSYIKSEIKGQNVYGITFGFFGDMILTPSTMDRKDSEEYQEWKKSYNKEIFKKDIKDIFKKITENIGVAPSYWRKFFEEFVIHGGCGMAADTSFDQSLRAIHYSDSIVRVDLNLPIKELTTLLTQLKKDYDLNKNRIATYLADEYLSIAELKLNKLTDKEIGIKIGMDYKTVMHRRQAMEQRDEWKLSE